MQRPDLMQQVEQLRAAGAEIKAAKTAYLPTLSFDGSGGEARIYAQQNLGPGLYGPDFTLRPRRPGMQGSV